MIKLKIMRLLGHVACMEEIRNGNKILGGRQHRKKHTLKMAMLKWNCAGEC
jgi:hypothetical protein